MIQAKGIVKSFGENHVLKGVDVDFYPGKTNLIIGRSGSGKTVFLKTILGLFEPDGGSIHYGEEVLGEMSKQRRKTLRQEIGMVFQGGALFDSMSVAENIRFPLEMFSSMTEHEKDARVKFVMDRVRLEGADDLFPSEISGGMQKRVSIARAISMSPNYLFCDEPNSGLDPKTSIVIDELIHSLTKEFGTTTIINSHDMNSVLGIGEHIVYLHEGKKHWEGSNEEVIHSGNKELDEFIFASKFLQNLKNGK